MNTQSDVVITIDAGGTSLKWADIVLDELSGCLREHNVEITPLNSNGTAEQIIDTFTSVIGTAYRNAKSMGSNVVGVCISTPGPFDVERGIPLMKRKYQSVYGMRLGEAFRARLGFAQDFPIKFEYDMDAFLIGESFHGAARGYHRAIGITIGTGLGSAFMIDGKIVKSSPDMPDGGALWRLPLRNGIVDDYLSQGGIISDYEKLSGEMSINGGVRYIAQRALSGEASAIQVFADFGAELGRFMMPIARDFHANCLVCGGQISKSFDLFSKTLMAELEPAANLSKVSPAELTDMAPLYGAAKSFVETQYISIS